MHTPQNQPPVRLTPIQPEALVRPKRWPRLRRWLWRLTLVAGIVLAVAIAVVALYGRQWAQDTLEQRLKEEATERQLRVEWQSLTLGYDLSLDIQRASLQDQQGHQHLTFERLHAYWSLEDLLDGQTMPVRVALDGLKGTIDLEALRASKQDPSPQAPRTDAPDPTPEPTTSAKAVALLDRVARTELKISNGHILVSGLPKDLGPVELTELSFYADQAHGPWHGELVAHCKQGCEKEERLELSALRTELGIKAQVELSTPKSIAVDLPKTNAPTTIKVGGAEVFVPSDGPPPTLSALDLAFEFDVRGYEGHMNIKRVRLRGGLDNKGLPKHVELLEPVVEVQWPHNPGRPQKPIGERFKHRRKPMSKTGKWRRRLLASLPNQRQLLELKQQALPWLRRVSVDKGELIVKGKALHIQGISVQHDEDKVRLGLTEGHGEIALWLEDNTPGVDIELDQVPVDKLKPLFAHKGWTIGGDLSGQIALKIGGPSLNPPPPTYIGPWDTEGGFHIQGNIAIQHGHLHIKPLSSAPIEHQQATIAFNATYNPPSQEHPDRLTLHRATVSLPSRAGDHDSRATAHLEFAATHALDGREPDVDLRLWMDQTPCEVAIGAIPQAMLPHLHDQIKARGHFSPELTVSVNMAHVYGLELNVAGLPDSCRLKSLGKYSPAFLNTDFKQEVREGVSRAGIMIGPGTSNYVRLNAIPNHVKIITYQTEEGGFFNSPGFSVSLIKRAVRLNLDRERYAYGGSTLSQQLVKNLFLTRTKTLSRKLEEAFIVWKMEELVDKHRILELYLNCIEYGPDLYGIRRAARFYFGKTPSALSPIEGAFLASIKPSPLVGPNFMGQGHTPTSGWWQVRMQRLMTGMYRRGIISKAHYEAEAPYIVFFRTFRGDRKAVRERAKQQLGMTSDSTTPQALPRTSPRQNQRKRTNPFPPGAKRYRIEDLPRQ